MSTIRDVAKAAGVSIASVSRVLNQDTKYKMTPETRERILRVAQELDYQLPQRTSKVVAASDSENALPDSYSQAHSHKIGCVLSVIKKKYNDPYFLSILSGAENRLREKGYDISFLRTGPELEDTDCLTSTFQEPVSGLILMESLNSATYDFIRKHVPHIVGIDTQRPEIDNVGYDHHQVAANATRYLIGQGHTKIGYLGGSGESRQIRDSQRYQGFYMAMQHAGLDVRKEWVIDCHWDEEICAAKITELCRSGNCPTAFFVGSDLMAMAAMNSFHSNNLAVPADIAVMGLSDLEMSKYTNPPLTTFHVPTEEIGIVAADLLISRIEGNKLLPQKVLLPTTLVLRESV